MNEADNERFSLREQLGRIEERATDARDNSRATRSDVAELSRTVAALVATVAALSGQVQSHFADDRRHFDDAFVKIDGVVGRVTALESGAAGEAGTQATNRWWVTAIATLGGAIAGGIAGNFRPFGGH